jgi:hypothetical protein
MTHSIFVVVVETRKECYLVVDAVAETLARIDRDRECR